VRNAVCSGLHQALWRSRRRNLGCFDALNRHMDAWSEVMV
jgi:hypothetical protein